MRIFYLILCLVSIPFFFSNFTEKKNYNYTFSDSINKNAKDSTYNEKLIIANELFKKSNFEGALYLALDIYTNADKTTSNEEIIFSSCLLIGNIFSEIREYEKSIQYYRRLLDNTDKRVDDSYSKKYNLKDFRLKKNPQLYFRLGNAYVQLYNSSDLKTQETKDLKEKIKDLGGIQKEKQKKTIETIKSYKDSALFFFNSLEKMQSLNKEIIDIKGKSYITLSALYLSDSLFTKAENYADRAIKMYKLNDDKLNLAKAHTNFASIFLYRGDFENAKKRYYFALDAIKNLKTQRAVELKSALYYNIAWAMRNLEDYKAYDNLEIYYELKDYIDANETKKKISQTELKHAETIKKLENDKEVEIARIKKSSTDKLLIALSSLILLISAIIIYNYKLRQRNLQLKLEQSKLLEEQNIDRIKSDAQVKILNATIDGKETERKQIAETLHDSVSALLSSANMHLSATKKQFNGSTPLEILKTQEIILEASQKVRDLSHNLVSSILLKFGLEYAIKDIAKKYSNSEIQFHTEFTNVARYSQEFEIKLYNVINELINNILKHSMASNAYIVIEDKNDFLSVLIEDDGVGFNYQFNNERTGLGLNQIEARIQMMNGNFLVESSKDRGAKITISVPVQKKTEISYV